MRTHPDIGLMMATCSKSAADLLQLARFWLCNVNNSLVRYENRDALNHVIRYSVTGVSNGYCGNQIPIKFLVFSYRY